MQKFVGTVALMLATGAMAAEIVDGVAAVVNDRVITYSEVREYVAPVIQQLRRSYSGQELIEKVRAAQKDALNNLIERTLIIQEFKDKGYSFPETVIDAELNDVVAKDFGGDRALFTKTLQAQNMTLSQYREQLRDRIIVQAMRNRKTQNEVVVSPYKIEHYYQEHLDDFRVDDQIKLRMIYIKRGQPVAPTPPATNPTIASSLEQLGMEMATDAIAGNATNTVLELASSNSSSETTQPVATTVPVAPPPPPVDPRKRFGEEIVSKLDAGESFESMARVYSEAKEAKQGGDWGWIGKDVLRKELNEIAFTLKAGQHSQLIETAEGYYILQLDDVKPAHTKALAEVRDEIEKILLQQQRTKMQEQWVKDLRAKAYIRMF